MNSEEISVEIMADGEIADKLSENANEERAEKSEEKTLYTAEEVRALLQSEGDRRVSGARRKWEKEMGDEIESAAESRARELTDQLNSEKENLRVALAEAEEKMAHRERELSVMRGLDSRALPQKLLPIFMAAEQGSEEELMDSLTAVIADEAARQVMERLASPAPTVPPKKRVPTEEEFRTLPVAELQRMLK